MLLNSIFFEVKRAMHGKNFAVSLLIGCFIALMDLCAFHTQYKGSNDMILLQAWIGTDFQFAYNSLFYVLLPVIACLPYAGSYYWDINSGYDKNILIKVSRKNYIVAKGAAVYISAFAAVVLPLLLSASLCGRSDLVR